jgi:hypothetical protein
MPVDDVYVLRGTGGSRLKADWCVDKGHARILGQSVWRQWLAGSFDWQLHSFRNTWR